MGSFEMHMPQTLSTPFCKPFTKFYQVKQTQKPYNILESSYKVLPRKVKTEALQGPVKVLTVFTFKEL